MPFSARSKNAPLTDSAVARRSVPQAIRPAVEIIARLSAERSRLRREVERLKSESAPAVSPSRVESSGLAQGEVRRLEQENHRLERENKELKRELRRLEKALQASQRVAAASAQRPQPGDAADQGELRALITRLERSVQALERGPAAPATTQVTGSAAPRPAAGSGEGPRRDRAAGKAPSGMGGNGLMASLLKANLQLRGDEAPASTPRAAPRPASRPTTTHEAEPLRPASRLSGALAALVADNQALRHGRGRARFAS